METALRDGFFEKFPPAVLRTLAKNDQERDPFVFSPSSAGYCLRQKMLRQHHDYWLDIKNVWSMARGSALHNYVDEHIAGQSEQRLGTDLVFTDEDETQYTIRLEGTLDYYEPSTKTLYDYKTTKTFVYYNHAGKRINKEYPTPEHELQVNIYAWLLRHHDNEVKRAYLWYVSGSDTMKDITVELWPNDEVENVIYTMAERLIIPKYHNQLPPAYQPGDEEYWQCKSCPVALVCREKEELHESTPE